MESEWGNCPHHGQREQIDLDSVAYSTTRTGEVFGIQTYLSGLSFWNRFSQVHPETAEPRLQTLVRRRKGANYTPLRKGLEITGSR
jgi:hypothetical protein